MQEMHKSLGFGRMHLDQKSPQATRLINRLNFYSQDDVSKLLIKCLPHFRLKKGNAKLLLELIRMKKSYKKTDWYKGRCDEIFKLMKWENHKDHVGFDWAKENINLEDIQKYTDNCKMSVMDSLENIGTIVKSSTPYLREKKNLGDKEVEHIILTAKKLLENKPEELDEEGKKIFYELNIANMMYKSGQNYSYAIGRMQKYIKLYIEKYGNIEL